ncbi:hypothetical protein D3H55_04640 [Bacillus salacetis]|uniref:Uncharacterized protein n=1 Tax=Bacillus salacetis TaxID=2315464 RepID=A0A3A1R8Q4_9BACI|nr:hypothetical protein [Bacillus salacetis]RIW37330.1 hypothetical protein D3H55_04640 [Bacillus salacetis]
MNAQLLYGPYRNLAVMYIDNVNSTAIEVIKEVVQSFEWELITNGEFRKLVGGKKSNVKLNRGIVAFRFSFIG